MNWKNLICADPDHILNILRIEAAPVNVVWVAQELGVGVFTVKSQEHSVSRRQAFEFAEKLLIPEWLFWPYFQYHIGPEPVAEGVAKHFRVPLGVAQHRVSTILSGCKD